VIDIADVLGVTSRILATGKPHEGNLKAVSPD